MKRCTLLILFLFLCNTSLFAQKSFQNWNAFETAFVEDFKRLHIADLQIYYVDNLELIQSKRNIAKQEKVFLEYKQALQLLDYAISVSYTHLTLPTKRIV